MARPSLVAVVGGSYVGVKVAQLLAASLPPTHRVALVQESSHFGHLFVYPRFSVYPGHEHKAFIPYTGIFADSPPDSGIIIRARALAIHGDRLQLDRQVVFDGQTIEALSFSHLVLATGTYLPGRLYDTKLNGVEALQVTQRNVERAKTIAVLGGGASTALDLRELYPDKRVILVHSRHQLMNRFHPALDRIVKDRCAELGVELVLGEGRAELPKGGWPMAMGDVEVKLASGRVLHADYVLPCTGALPSSQLIADASPSSLSPNSFVRVLPSLQIADAPPNLFALGDVADIEGAAKAARPGFAQAEVVTKNILSQIRGEEPVATYRADIPGIHLTLGLKRNVKFRNPLPGQDEPSMVKIDDGGELDMGVASAWTRRGIPLEGRDYSL